MSVENETRTILLATNQNQSITAQVSPIDIRLMAYSSYGHRSAPQLALTCLGFNGERREQHTGWYIMGNGYRAYNPILRRFHSPDRSSPFAGGGLNPYAYCLGDPINYRDPSGHLGIFGLGASLLRRVATPAGALTATAVVSGGAAFAVMDKAPAIGTALLLISAASGLGAGYILWGRSTARNVTKTNRTTVLSGRSGSGSKYELLHDYSLSPNRRHDFAFIATQNGPTTSQRRIEAKLQTTTAPERKEYWPGAMQEMRHQRVLQQQQQEIRQINVEIARIDAEQARLIRRGTRPAL